MKVNDINFLSFYSNGALIGDNSWESVLNYKLLNANAGPYKFECDRSPEVKEILEEIFGESRYPDTLFSPQSYIKLYMRHFHSDLLEYDAVPNISGVTEQMVMEGRAKKGRIRNPSIWAFYIKMNDVKVPEPMLEFMQAVYTLPNFSPVCRGFNLGRAYKTQDNFLIALYHIYDYFKKRQISSEDSNPREVLARFLSENKIKNGNRINVTLTKEVVVSEVKKWLDNYSSFAHFVEKYYFQDFLEDPDNPHSKPKEIWKGMFSGKLQPSKEEFFPSIESLTDAIRARGSRINDLYGEKLSNTLLRK